MQALCKLTLGVLIITMSSSAQLIRPLSVYKNIIEGIHLYFNNTCIILLHTIQHPMETQGMQKLLLEKCFLSLEFFFNFQKF